MADNIQATPRNELLGLLSDAYKWMQSPERAQQMQGFAGLLGTTGVPQTIERMAYGEPLTNIGRANVPLLKPETADALMTVAPFAPKGMKMIRATEGMPVGMSIKDVSQDGLMIKKGYSTTSTGREKPIWNIVDTNRNDEIVETFDRKGDASWLLDKWRQNTQQTQSKQLNAPQQAPLSIAEQKSSLLDMTRTPSEADINAAIMDERGGLLGAVTPQPKNIVSKDKKIMDKAEKNPKVAMTSDGYKFYEQPDGTYTDGDMTFESLDELFSIDPQLTVDGKIYSPKSYFEEEVKGTSTNPLYDDLSKETNPLTSPFADLYKKGFK